MSRDKYYFFIKPEVKMKKTKTYKKAKVLAKNNPQGSYAAGCPSHNKNTTGCISCKVAQ